MLNHNADIDQSTKNGELLNRDKTREAYNKTTKEFYCTDHREMCRNELKSTMRIGKIKRVICLSCEARRNGK